jgi:WhiB family transcriptional regulator, redox-sensing transcriptional regulator
MREVNVRGVNWDQANCRGLNTEIFFYEESDLRERQLDNKAIRKICFTCPIRQECLQAGMEEEYGIWGGFTRQERAHIRRNNLIHKDLSPARRHLGDFNITLEQAIEGVA